MENQGNPMALQPMKSLCWRLCTEKHREGWMPSTEKVAAVINSYTQLQLPAWHIQMKLDGLSSTHSKNKEVDRRKGSGEVLRLS